MTDGRIGVVVSDFGGVLTTPLMQSFIAFQDRTGITTQQLAEALGAATDEAGDNPLFRMERGEISEVEFIAALAASLEAILGHPPEMHGFKEIYFDALDPNQPMIELMRELGAGGYRMAMLTNNVREWEPLWRAMLPVDEIFEMVVDSAFVGVRKPEPEIYDLLLERLGVPAEACLFVDDVEINCDAARKAGITAVHFRDNEQAIAEIRTALGD